MRCGLKGERRMKRKAAKPPENAVVLVLGAKVFENRLSTTLQNRVQAAADYLRAHPEAVCITTGGQGRDEPRSEGRGRKARARCTRYCARAHHGGDALAHDAREPALFEGDPHENGPRPRGRDRDAGLPHAPRVHDGAPYRPLRRTRFTRRAIRALCRKTSAAKLWPP